MKTILPSLSPWIAGALGVFTILGLPAAAQVPLPDASAAQITGLFEQSCVRFTGNAVGLRAWVGQNNLHTAPEAPTRFFLNGRLGHVFNASNSEGKYLLVSYDDGACEVVAMSGDYMAVKQTLLSDLKGDGLVVTPVFSRIRPDGGSEQQMYRASLGSVHWMLSVTAHPHSDAPDLAPELALAATIDDGSPAVEQ